jgi:biotin carboxyl carrier protein
VTHHEYLRGDRLHAVELTDLNDGTFLARLTVREAGASRRDAPLAIHDVRLHAAALGAGCYSVLVGQDVHDVLVSAEGDRRVVSLAAGTVELELVDRYRAAGVGARGVASGPQAIASPMPGRVVKVAVVAGDAVAAGQTVVVVEAMKMANELRSPIAGVVSLVHAEVGAAVEGGRPLVVVTPAVG